MEKLVRDKIPEIITSEGRNAEFRIANNNELVNFINQKLVEEVTEFCGNPSIEELVEL